MNEMIFDLQRFANIDNNNDDSLISGTSKNDYITNNAYNVTINAGKATILLIISAPTF